MTEHHDPYGLDEAYDTQRTASLEDAPGRESWRHPVNVGQLVMGIAFAGMVLVWALIVGDVVDGGDIRWLMPIPWVSAGVVGLVAMALAARRRG